MNDLISRQAAIDTLNDGAELLKRVLDDADIVGLERAKYEWGLGLIESYISDMKELPSAESEKTKEGEWIAFYPRITPYEYRCSVCGAVHRARYDYCPTCGSDMKES